MTTLVGDSFSAEVLKSALLLHERGVPDDRITEVGAAVIRLASTIYALEVTVDDLRRAEEVLSASRAREDELKEQGDDAS